MPIFADGEPQQGIAVWMAVVSLIGSVATGVFALLKSRQDRQYDARLVKAEEDAAACDKRYAELKSVSDTRSNRMAELESKHQTLLIVQDRLDSTAKERVSLSARVTELEKQHGDCIEHAHGLKTQVAVLNERLDRYVPKLGGE